MAVLSEIDLQKYRDLATELALKDDCTIQNLIKTRDSAGTNTEIPVTIATVKANLTQPSQGLLQAYASRFGTRTVWQVQMPYGTTVQEGNRLLINGQTLLVQEDLTAKSYAIFTEVVASETK